MLSDQARACRQLTPPAACKQLMLHTTIGAQDNRTKCMEDQNAMSMANLSHLSVRNHKHMTTNNCPWPASATSMDNVMQCMMYKLQETAPKMLTRLSI